MRWDDAEKNLVATMWREGYHPERICQAVNRCLEAKGIPVKRSLGSVILQLEKMGYLPKGSCKLRRSWLLKYKALEFPVKKLTRACGGVEEFSPKKARKALR